jgi:tRNA G18 (ribose-2'-O)-methylase SpoU
MLSGNAASSFRGETRRQRYNQKAKNATIMPVSIGCVNIAKDANIAFIARAAACFGAQSVHCVGSYPNRDVMNDLSGSTFDYIDFKQFSTPSDFIGYCRKNDIRLISFELPSELFPAIPFNEYQFDFGIKQCVVVGSETMGVPNEVLMHSERVYIEMPGIGFSLNTSQVANIALYTAASQYQALTKLKGA